VRGAPNVGPRDGSSKGERVGEDSVEGKTREASSPSMRSRIALVIIVSCPIIFSWKSVFFRSARACFSSMDYMIPRKASGLAKSRSSRDFFGAGALPLPLPFVFEACVGWAKLGPGDEASRDPMDP